MSDACCEFWRDAQQSGSDAEEYSSLIGTRDGEYRMGSSDLPSIKFCPWCGADKTQPSPLQAAAQIVVDTIGDSTKEWDDLKNAIGYMDEILKRKTT